MTLDVDAPTGPTGPDGPDRGDAPGPAYSIGGSTEATARRRSPLWFRLSLALITLVALGVRLLNVTTWRPTCTEDLLEVARNGGPATAVPQEGCFRIWGDSAYSFIQGRHIAEGNWFIDSYGWFASKGEIIRPSSGDPPLFALFLGLLSKLGITTGHGQRIATCVVGVVGVVLLATLVRRLIGPRAALIAGLIAAVFPMLWINDGMLLSESLYVPVILVAIHAAYSFWERPGYRTAAGFGIAMALAALTRAEALILLVVMPLPLLWGLRRLGWGRLLRLGVVAVGVGGLLIAPWLAYNMTRFHNPALMTSATGAVLSSSNCDVTYYGESIGYYGNCFNEYVAKGWMLGKVPTCTPEAVEAIAGDPLSPEQGRCWPNDPSFDETDRDKFSSELAIRYMKENTGRIPVVMVARVGRMWDLYTPELGRDDEPLGQNVRFNWQVEGRGKMASRVGVVMFWAMLPLAALGAFSLWRRRVPISPLISMTIVITVTAAVTFGITRYRVPVDVVVVVLAAAGLSALLDKLLGLLGVSPSASGLSRLRRDTPVDEPAVDGEPIDAEPRPAGPRGASEVLAGIVPAGASTATSERSPREGEP